MTLTVRRPIGVAVIVVLVASAPAFAQKVTTIEELTLRQALNQLAGPLPGEAIGLATAVETATAPFGPSSGGFVFKLDPSTGLLARTATTFGPSFSSRAITSGEGQVTIGANFRSTTYDELSAAPLDRLQLGAINATSPGVTRTATANLDMSSRMVILSGGVGVSENLDIGAAIPLMSVNVQGTSVVTTGDGVVSRLTEGGGVSSGLGDIAALMKYRFYKFGTDLPDAGGMAVVLNMHLPTGSRDNLRGLGVTRTLGSVVASGRIGRLQPHAEGGFEYWSKGVDLATGLSPGDKVTMRHQIQYAAGIELEAAPKLTVLLDFLGQHVRGAGKVGYVTDFPGANPAGITSIESLVGLAEGIQKFTLVPGMKLNLKGKLLLSLSALITIKNNGLHSTVTPVAGVDLTL